MKNKVTTYLLYAIGEIILVVLGILIAVSIDDWNEQRKNINQEKVLLNNVIVSLENDSIAFNRLAGSLDRIKQLYHNLFLISKGELKAEDLEDTHLLRRSSAMTPITKSTFPNLAEEVSNQQIKNEVLSYYQSIDLLEETEKDFNEFIEYKIRDHLAKKYINNYDNVLSMENIGSVRLHNDILVKELENEYFRQLLFNAR